MRRKMRFGRVLTTVVATLAVALATTACGSERSSSSGGSGSGDDKTITIGVLQGWTEDVAATYLWKQVLEEKGYTVSIKELSEPGPLFQGLSGGDIDLFLDTWLPITHEPYVEKQGDKIEDLGVWYDNAKLTIAVPEYVDVTSIADLKGKADMFGGEIVGIEPGAGLTRVTKEEAMPGYGLDGEYTLRTSSSPAMLAALKDAVDAKKPIVVTLWRPHWAYAAYPIKDLEDPKGLMGDAEEIHTYARAGFSKDFPDVAKWLGGFTMTDEQLGSLEDLMVNEYGEGKEAEAVAAWIKENADYVASLTGK